MTSLVFSMDRNKKIDGPYEKRNGNYISPKSQSLSNEYRKTRYKSERDITTSKTFNFILGQINKNHSSFRDLSIKDFLNPYIDKISDYSVEEDIDSDFRILEIKSDKISLPELFELADVLNHKSLENGLDFVVIAGV